MDYLNKDSNYRSANKHYDDKKQGRAFYSKLFFLYILNLVDWLCTEVLIASGRFFEANPIMQPVLKNFTSALLIKGILPLILVISCAVIYKLADTDAGFLPNLLLNIGITAYVLLNLWHIFNFVLLFFYF